MSKITLEFQTIKMYNFGKILQKNEWICTTITFNFKLKKI